VSDDSNNKVRAPQIDAVISTAALVTHCDPAETMAVLIGAITIMCARSKDCPATLQIAINSLSVARDIAVAHEAKKGAVCDN
jgi:hypothetical protein